MILPEDWTFSKVAFWDLWRINRRTWKLLERTNCRLMNSTYVAKCSKANRQNVSKKKRSLYSAHLAWGASLVGIVHFKREKAIQIAIRNNEFDRNGNAWNELSICYNVMSSTNWQHVGMFMFMQIVTAFKWLSFDRFVFVWMSPSSSSASLLPVFLATINWLKCETTSPRMRTIRDRFHSFHSCKNPNSQKTTITLQQCYNVAALQHSRDFWWWLKCFFLLFFSFSHTFGFVRMCWGFFLCGLFPDCHNVLQES